jgi:hypothetical protein
VGAQGFGLAARLEVSAPTGDDDQLAGEGTGVYVPSLSADWRIGRSFVAGEVGARIRPTNELEGARIGTELVTALGLGYDILPRGLLTGVLEAWALPDFAEQHTISITGPATVSTPNGSTIAPAEWQLSARTSPLPGGDFAIQLGGGGDLALTNGAVTTPRFRFTLGLRWAPTGRPRSASAPSPPPPPPPTPIWSTASRTPTAAATRTRTRTASPIAWTSARWCPRTSSA